MRFHGAHFGRARWAYLALTWSLVWAPLLLWGKLAEEVWDRESFRFDAPILLWLHAHAAPSLDRAMLGLSRVGGFALLLVAGAMCALYLFLARRREALFVALCMGGAGALNVGAKIVFQRARPDLWISLAPEGDYSFPSGHAMVSSAFVAMCLALIWRATESKARAAIWRSIAAIAGLTFVAAVGASRLYLGVHYPSDILAGWLASFSWVALVRNLSGLPAPDAATGFATGSERTLTATKNGTLETANDSGVLHKSGKVGIKK